MKVRKQTSKKLTLVKLCRNKLPRTIQFRSKKVIHGFKGSDKFEILIYHKLELTVKINSFSWESDLAILGTANENKS